MSRAELELIRDDAVVRVIRIGEEPVGLGRDLANTVVLLDEDVSAHHAVVSLAPDGLTVRDLRSTNGTFVNGERVADLRALGHGDELQLGADVRLRVRLIEARPAFRLVLHDLTAGTVYAVEGDRFVIGTADECDLQIPEGPARAGSLLVHPDGEVWLHSAEDDRAVAVDEVFEIHGRRLKLAHVPLGKTTTFRGMLPSKHPLSISVTLKGPGGPTATIRHTQESRQYTVTTENRATLLYVLAMRLRDDRAENKDDEQAGWCDDEDVLVAIWGKAALRQASSNYSVLLHRLRKEIEDAGFDPWLIEKRRGAVRLRVGDVEIT